ncbi:diguanylate cyclase [Thiohalorhabdus methylotrophus]|uniref:diguanylate cyclase n=1 Tax=Thiohalorhabdus methylotrophus TaxID=3242694 RepID=A0ABV4TRL0_9GAMM
MDNLTAFTPDIRTLTHLLAAVTLLTSAVYCGLWLQGTGARASGFWALGHGGGTLGYLLIGLRGVVPDYLSITLANPAVLGGGLLLVKGLFTLLERPFPARWAGAGLAITALAFAYFTHLQPDLTIRTLLATGIGTVILLAGALPLLRMPKSERRWVHIFIATAFLGVAAVQLLRFAGTLTQPAGAGLMEATAIHGFALVAILLGVVTWTLGFFWMITLDLRRDLENEVETRKRREETLRQSEQRFRAIFDNSATGIGFGDEQGNIILANDAFARLVGRSREELLGRNFLDLTHPDDRDAELELVERMLASGGNDYRLEKRYVSGKGHSVWVDLTVSAVRDEHGRTLHFVGVANDIGEHKALQEELKHQATYDRLTGTVNRLQFDRLLEREQERVSRYASPATLVMFDIDHFKAVNDTHGHDVGDTVLQELAGLVRQRLRETDVLARWGGEEFMVLLPETDAGAAATLGEELRRAVAAGTFADGLAITISLGLAELRPGDTMKAPLKRADDALYAAKHGGRNRLERADPETAPASSNRG